MKQMSTGFGLAVLGFGIAVLALSNLAGSIGNQAQAQSGSGRSIVSASIISNNSTLVAYRIWNDNTIDIRPLGNLSLNGVQCYANGGYGPILSEFRFQRPDVLPPGTSCPVTNNSVVVDGSWFTVDNGLTSFVSADVDASQSVDAADLGTVLSHYGETQEGNPPPPIDCTINAPR